MIMPTIVSIQVGLPAALGCEGADHPHDRPWTSGFRKTSVAGPVWVGRTNLPGDAQADLVHHGGVDKAVLAYSADHYAYWSESLGRGGLANGSFGENLTIRGLDETKVCIGDVWRAGTAEMEVSQPRQPCWKMSRFHRIDDLAAQVVANGRSGWYLRVRIEGRIEAGMEMTLVERPNPTWTVARASQVMHHQKDDLAAAAELGSLPVLSASWKKTLAERLATRETKHAPF
jgi:MOSC domain-containing protein YiiM